MLLKFMLTPLGLKLDKYIVRFTGGSLLNRLFSPKAGFEVQPALYLVTTGHKSGKKRSVALPYFQIDGRLFVVGSKGGAPTDPFWVQNLRKTPAVGVYLNRRRRSMKARVAAGEERRNLWDKVTKIVPNYAEYQTLTARELPVVILE